MKLFERLHHLSCGRHVEGCCKVWFDDPSDFITHWDYLESARMRSKSFDRPSASRRVNEVSRRRSRRSFRLFGEQLEDRRLLATYQWNDTADTFALSLAPNESLIISEDGPDTRFTLAGGAFSSSGGAFAPGSGTNTILIPTADLAQSLSVSNNLLTGAGGTNQVTFDGSERLFRTPSISA
jgi:hypothetical protein